MKFRTMIAAVATTLLLAACGGGGGGSTGSAPADPVLTADTVVIGDLVAYAQGESFRAITSCSGAVCTITFAGERTEIRVDEIDLRELDAGRFIGEHTRNGVSVARVMLDEDGVSYDTYGTWGDYGGAVAGTFAIDQAEFVMPISLGVGSNSNPVSGSATWTGAMVGAMLGTTAPGAAVIGDASLQAHFASTTLGLSFTGIQEAAGGARSADIVWQGIPMRAGTFSATGLEGRFYGPNHEEAGGVFERAGIAGGFALVRQ